MKSPTLRLRALAGATILAACFASQANAGCGPDLPKTPGDAPRAQPAAPAPAGFIQAAFVRVNDRDDDRFGFGNGPASIVGLWKIEFLSKGNPGIPDDFVLDDGYATWHADGTELMNSSRPAFSGNFCMGAWKQVNRSTFKLNHFALSWDTNNGTTFIGPTNIRETVVIDDDGDSYRGTVTITQYQQDGVTPAGVPIHALVSGKRINP